jgi:kojibiose phosphorylase
MTLTSDRDVTVEVAGGIDADVRTNGYDHFKSVTIARHDAASVSCGVTTDAGEIVQMVSELSDDSKTPPSAHTGEDRLGGATNEVRFVEEHRRGTLVVTVDLQAGRIATVEKRTAITTSRDLHPVGAALLLRELAATSYDALHRESADAWAARWQASDVVIEGDDRSQLAMRASLYHLMRCHVPGDDRVAIDAKGYAGEAYWGRFFWDTEMYLLPFFLYTDPARARTLVDFRVRSLPATMANAKSYGYPGARYATESDGDGVECCPNWQYRDHEIHVTADVVYAFAHYANAAQADYLAGAPRNVLLETARYWLARMDQRQGDDYPSLLGVMGPDEYAPITSNNAYTNYMVKFALRHSAEAARAAGLEGEAQQFADASRKLPIPTRADGLVLECEEFERLAEPRFEEFWLDRTVGFANQVSQERLYRSKCLKQADVLMMMFLFAGDFTDQQVRQAYEHYLPYTTHDSSLSVSVHAIIACRLGLDEQAWQFWRASSELDLDVQHGGAENGIHIAAAGANWQVAVLGFAGMATAMEASSRDAGVPPACVADVPSASEEPGADAGGTPATHADKMSATREGKMPMPQADVLTLRPRLPKGWTRLSFPIIWKGVPVYVEIARDKTVVTNRGQKALTVRVGDKQTDIPAGSRASF